MFSNDVTLDRDQNMTERNEERRRRVGRWSPAKTNNQRTTIAAAATRVPDVTVVRLVMAGVLIGNRKRSRERTTGRARYGRGHGAAAAAPMRVYTKAHVYVCVVRDVTWPRRQCNVVGVAEGR